MPRMTERERLADLEARQRKVAQEIGQTRRALRGKYAAIVSELPIEFLTERELRDILTHAIRAGGTASVATLKALPPATIAHNQQPDPRPQGVPATSTASRAQEAGVAQRATPHRSATDPLRVPERGDISRR